MFKAIRAYSEPNEISFRNEKIDAFIQDSILPGSYLILRDGTVGKAVRRKRMIDLHKDTFTVKIVRGENKGTERDCIVQEILSVKNEKVRSRPDFFSVHQKLNNGRFISRTLSIASPHIRSKFFEDTEKTVTLLVGAVPAEQKNAMLSEIERVTKGAKAKVVLLETDTGRTLSGEQATGPIDVTVLTAQKALATRAHHCTGQDEKIGLGPKTIAAWDEQLDASDLVITVGDTSSYSFLLKRTKDHTNRFLRTNPAYLDKSLLKRTRHNRIHPYVTQWVRDNLAETIVDHRIIGNTCYLLTKLSIERPQEDIVYKNDYIISYDINDPQYSIKRLASGFETNNTKGPHRITTLEQLQKAWELIRSWNEGAKLPLNRDTLIAQYTHRMTGRI